MPTGLGPWLSNFTQSVWSDQNPTALADIPAPYLEYGLHNAFKMAQISSFIGGCLVHPVYRFYLRRKLTPETTTNNSHKVIRNICRRLQGRILLGGLALVPAVTLGSILYHGYSRKDVVDRCYAIRCNNDAMVYDRSTVVIGLLGWYWKRFQGMVDGVNLAGVYILLYVNFLKERTNVILVDRMEVEKEKRFKNIDEARDLESELLSFINLRKNVWDKMSFREGNAGST